MKKLLISAALISASISANAAFILSGTGLLNTPGLSAGNVGVLLNLDSGSDFSGISSLAAGTNMSTPGAISVGGTAFTIVGVSSNATSSFGSTSLGFNLSNLSYAGGFGGNDQFAVLLFPNLASVSNPTAGTSLSLWRATTGGVGVTGWVWPGTEPTGSIGFAASPIGANIFTQLGSGASSTLSFSVVPEPSTYALMALGGLVLFFIARRRKAQV
jgi:hypothetical protein